MSDARLEVLKPRIEARDDEDQRITTIRIKGYRFFADTVELLPKGKNLLVYGENGTGKSTLYRALGVLAGLEPGVLKRDTNIFSGNDPELEFTFTNGSILTVDSDMEELPEAFAFLKPLSVFIPLLDYKRLLRVHFSADSTVDHINIYGMLRELFKDYPHLGGGTLSDVRSFPEYFQILDDLLNKELLSDINTFIKVFDSYFSVSAFEFTTELDAAGRPNPRVSIKIEYHETQIDRYHQFLNEARLSALAISIFFSSILRLHGTISGRAFRMLVLDDLLISLDMSNRLKLLEILTTRFAEFQIFFFTHDKELFELYKYKLDWTSYEFYLDDSGPIPAALIKQGKSELERAKVFFTSKDFDACALLLRKGFERLLKTFLTPAEQRNRNCEELDLSDLIGKATSKSSGEVKAILEKLNSDRRHILNPLCHRDNRAIYNEEIRSALADLEKLSKLISAT